MNCFRASKFIRTCLLPLIPILLFSGLQPLAFSASQPPPPKGCVFRFLRIWQTAEKKDAYAGPSAGTLATVDALIERAPKIDYASIDAITKVENPSGRTRLRIEHGVIGSEKVFIKVSRAEVARPDSYYSPRFRNEVAWLRRLQALGFGAKFFGTTEVDGRHALVTSRVDGFDLQFVHITDMLKSLPPEYVARPSMIQKLERFKAILRSEGIDAGDLQIIASRDGTEFTVTDPELFRPAFEVEPVAARSALIDELLTMLPRGR